MNAKRPPRLFDSFIKTVKECGRYGDGRGGHGLSLLVKERAMPGSYSKTFSQRLRINGEKCTFGLGAYPIVRLAEARTAALKNARRAAKGRNPRNVKKCPTFSEAADAYIKVRRVKWKSNKTNHKKELDWRSTLRRFVIPHIGGMRVDKIKTPNVVACLNPIWNELRYTAKILLSRISAIMDHCKGLGYVKDNPADASAVDKALQGVDVKPGKFRAVHYTKIAETLQAIRTADSRSANKLCMEFIILTACRPGEAREAVRDEIDLEKSLWVIPGERTKTDADHAVPLSSRAREILAEAKDLYPDSHLIFPSTKGTVIAGGTLSGLCKRLKLDGTPHGFRTTFKGWCKKTKVDRDLSEEALAHTVGGTEGSYDREEVPELRAPIMEAYWQFIYSQMRDLRANSGAE